MAATFAANAQNKEFNKEETVAYMEKILVAAEKAAYNHPSDKIGAPKIESLTIDGKTLTIGYDDGDKDRIELDPYSEVIISYVYLTKNQSGGKWYTFKIGESPVISNRISL